jgi:CheY-like chemotaxis protein
MNQFQAAVAGALGCAELQTFLFESEKIIIALTDRPDLNKETIVSRLQSEIKSRLRDGNLSASFACLQPDQASSPNELLAQAMAMLESLPVPRETEPVKRVLVIDDDASVLKLMTDLLAKIDEKLDVRSTTSGYDACIHFGNWKPDLVILDLHLPDIDGKKVFQSMIKGDQARRMKFLAVSGYPDEIREIMTMGCNDYLAKPFDFKQFVDKVRNLLA